MALLAGCGGTAAVPASSAAAVTDVAVTDLGASAQSSYAGTDPRLVLTRVSGALEIEAFMGQQRTAGYAIKIDRVTLEGTTLVVRATFSTPSAGAITAQVITSPMARVSVAAASVSAARDAHLVDQTGATRAAAGVP